MTDALRTKILCEYLGHNKPDHIYDPCVLEDYLVLTNAQANKAAKEYILESLWAFNADFILAHSKIQMDAKDLQHIQEKLCESANTLIRGMIKNIKQFMQDAVYADGRGHFISTYDGKENEFEYNGTTYYIYKIN